MAAGSLGPELFRVEDKLKERMEISPREKTVPAQQSVEGNLLDQARTHFNML